ncbi:uncharacterized protein LOC111624166 [Centruroides sculpturatus]|uniref:uncharacterized protein LOC111624166 n=1 Tax=Centruroides sculpturatus TaxID=218467 RepID=UPI000C6CC3CE|nr:uncharacterized protein LOC111624166 [Centruroides sculpturatus]
MEDKLPSKSIEEIENAHSSLDMFIDEDLTSSFNLQSLSTIVDELIESNVSLQDCDEKVDQACYSELTRKSGKNTVESCNLSLSLVAKSDEIADLINLSSTPIKRKSSTKMKKLHELSDIIVDNSTCGEETNHNSGKTKFAVCDMSISVLSDENDDIFTCKVSDDKEENVFTSCNSPQVSPIAKNQIFQFSLSASAAVENRTTKNEKKDDLSEQLTEVNKDLSLKKETNVISKEGPSAKSENFEPSRNRKQTQSNKIKKRKKKTRIVRNRISCNKENRLEKRNETKTGESSVKETKKPKYVIEDPLELGDINDPEWENVRCLNTDDERYSAVKACWGSTRVPKPNKDLTRHNYRLRKMKKEDYKAAVNDTRKGKRTATSGEVDIVDDKRRKVETAFCTETLDRKIDQERQLYKESRDQEEQKYFMDLQEIKRTSCETKQLLEQVYLQKIKKTKSSSNVYNPLIERVEKWKMSKEVKLRAEECREIDNAKRRFDSAKGRLEHNFNVTLNKLNKAREEVLKFNKFYCGLSKSDPTVLKGKRLKEVRIIEEMYKTYDKVYAPARM